MSRPKTTKKSIQKWESSSPTVKIESVLINSVIDAYEQKFVGVYGLPGAFLYAEQMDF
jgi:hypothetical protein